MSETIVGQQVNWGISSSVKTVSDSIIAGIVQDASASPGGNTEEIVNEDGDIITRVDHGYKNEITVSLIATTSGVVLPAKGSEVNVGAVTDIDGIDVSAGRIFVEDSSSSQAGASATTVSLTLSHYPDMPADQALS